MRPVSETPTELSDYALLSAVYGSLLAATAASARRAAPIPPGELPQLALATFAVSKLVVKEKAEAWAREPFVVEEGTAWRPKGRRMRYAIGELLLCTRCTGAWGALALVGLRLHSPSAGRAVSAVLATSAGNDFAHTAFAWLCARADVGAGEKELTLRAARQAA